MTLINDVDNTIETVLSIDDINEFSLSCLEDSSSIIYSVWSREGDLIHITAGVERILDMPSKSLLGKKWCDFIDQKDYDNIISDYLANKDDKILKSHIKIKKNNGDSEWFICNIKKIKKADKNFYAVMLEHLNNKENYDQLIVQSEKMAIAGQLAAGIVHEIRNPLTSIKGFVQLLQSGVASKPAYFDIMIDEIETMEAMATELLFIAKPLTDKKQLESINSMIDETILLLDSQATKNKINLKFCRSTDYQALCNRSQLKQVLVNLIKNAMEAIKTDGNIMIETRLDENQLLIDIHDDGPGIPNEIIKKLEEPFFTTKQEGTGLGLMITKELLNYHNGELIINSKISHGSTFSICLPYSI